MRAQHEFPSIALGYPHGPPVIIGKIVIRPCSPLDIALLIQRRCADLPKDTSRQKGPCTLTFLVALDESAEIHAIWSQSGVL